MRLSTCVLSALLLALASRQPLSHTPRTQPAAALGAPTARARARIPGMQVFFWVTIWAIVVVLPVNMSVSHFTPRAA